MERVECESESRESTGARGTEEWLTGANSGSSLIENSPPGQSSANCWMRGCERVAVSQACATRCARSRRLTRRTAPESCTWRGSGRRRMMMEGPVDDGGTGGGV